MSHIQYEQYDKNMYHIYACMILFVRFILIMIFNIYDQATPIYQQDNNLPYVIYSKRIHRDSLANTHFVRYLRYTWEYLSLFSQYYHSQMQLLWLTWSIHRWYSYHIILTYTRMLKVLYQVQEVSWNLSEAFLWNSPSDTWCSLNECHRV